jgi:hypothetical protein
MLRLKGRKVYNIPTHEFGTLRGSTFQKENITVFGVKATDIEVHDTKYWKKLGIPMPQETPVP